MKRKNPKKSHPLPIQGHYRAFIRKEALKFSSAHMTVFPDGTKEALHGHNYRPEVAVDLSDVSLEAMVPFAKFKEAMKEISRKWDEKVLLPELCPFLKIVKRSARETEILMCGKRYVFPSEEVVFLPVDNITTETLAGRYCAELLERLSGQLQKGPILGIEVRVDEIHGQGASFRWVR